MMVCSGRWLRGYFWRWFLTVKWSLCHFWLSNEKVERLSFLLSSWVCSFVWIGEVIRFTTTEAPHWEPQQVQIKHQDVSSWPNEYLQDTVCLSSPPVCLSVCLSFPLPFFIHLSTHLSCSPRSSDSRWGPSISQPCYYNLTLPALHPKAWLAQDNRRGTSEVKDRDREKRNGSKNREK